MATAIIQRYVDEHPKCAQRFAQAKDIFPNGVTHDARNQSPFPYYVSHAIGPHKWDIDGQRIIDYKTGHGAMILGHTHPDVVAAVNEQMNRGTHYSASTDLEIRWGSLVQQLVPCAEKVRFHSSGTEATMMAMRMARAYTGKSRIIKFEDHFHGWHDYAMPGQSTGLGGIPKETLSTMIVLPPNDISLVEDTLRSNDDVAGIILEPTGSHMGQRPIRPSFLTELREVTRQYGVVLIFDEVVTGFRTSKGGAQGYYGVTPDISSFAKILAGGLPGGAVAGKADLIDMIQLRDDPDFNRDRRIGHYGTYNANPLSAAAGATALNLIATTPVNDKADAMAARLKTGLNEMLSRTETPGCANGVASAIFLKLGVDHECDQEVCIMSEEDQHKSEAGALKGALTTAMYNYGVDSGPRFLLGAAHTEQDIDETVEAAEKAVRDMRAEGLF